MLTLRPFTSLDDLVRIKGISTNKLADIKEEGLACIGG
jgi:DNA uptake protein ComE-like DNA-binding protein